MVVFAITHAEAGTLLETLAANLTALAMLEDGEGLLFDEAAAKRDKEHIAKIMLALIEALKGPRTQ